MKFWQAMKIVEEGGKVRRTCWYHTIIEMGKSGDEIMVKTISGNYSIRSLSTNAFVAEDWEVVDPTPTSREEVMSPDELKLYNENIDGF